MNKLNAVFSQLKTAANELRGRIADIDKQLTDLTKQRDALNLGNVSKADFLEYVGASFMRKGARCGRELVAALDSGRGFARLERGLNSGDEFLGIRFLTGSNVPVVATEEAFYFYFGDLMVDRLGEALDALEWPDNAVPVALRRTQVEAIERDITELHRQRVELVAMLGEAGVAGA